MIKCIFFRSVGLSWFQAIKFKHNSNLQKRKKIPLSLWMKLNSIFFVWWNFKCSLNLNDHNIKGTQNLILYGEKKTFETISIHLSLRWVIKSLGDFPLTLWKRLLAPFSTQSLPGWWWVESVFERLSSSREFVDSRPFSHPCRTLFERWLRYLNDEVEFMMLENIRETQKVT